MNGYDHKDHTKLSSSKKLIFSTILICLPFILLFSLELYLCVINYGDNYKDNINFLFNMGILYLQYKQSDNAKNFLEEIKKLDPGFEKIPLLEQEIY